MCHLLNDGAIFWGVTVGSNAAGVTVDVTVAGVTVDVTVAGVTVGSNGRECNGRK